MKTEQLLRELGEIREEYIEEADPVKQLSYRRGARWLAAAAALLLIGGAGVLLLGNRLRRTAEPEPSGGQLYAGHGPEDASAGLPAAPTGAETPAPGSDETADPAEAPNAVSPGDVSGEPADTADDPAPTGVDPALLPKLTLPESFHESYGFEGYLAYSVDELADGNPWSAESCPIYLPVYENGAYDPAGYPTGLDREALKKQLQTLQDRGILAEVEDIEPLTDTPDGEERLYALRAVGEGFTAVLLCDGTVDIVYSDGLGLPEDFVFGGDCTQAQAEACLDRLTGACAEALGFKDPRAALFGDRDFSGRRLFRFGIYDAGEHAEQAILNFSFRQVQFLPGEDGRLASVRINDWLAAAKKLGDYPVIDPERAEQLLRDGHYVTSVPHGLDGTEALAKVELIYRFGPGERTLLPYYRFLVELTGVEGLDPQHTDGLRLFGAYYVPAVEPSFLENLPTYDGRFN